MSRVSRVPYHQNVYDLLLIEPRPIDGIGEKIRDWEQRTGLHFPAAMTEFYSTEAVIPTGENGTEPWILSMVDVWYQYSNMEPPRPINEVLQHTDQPQRVTHEVEPGPYFWVQTENQGVWLVYVRANDEDDPPAYGTDSGPWFFGRWERIEENEWYYAGRFTEMLFLWFAFYYYALDSEAFDFGGSFVPLRFLSYNADPNIRHLAPPKPYANGLWLRTPNEPFNPPVIDFLIDQFGEPEITSRPGNVSTCHFRPQGGTIRVTADEPTLTGGLSAWWIHAGNSERLAEFTRLLFPWGTLRDTLRADTDPAREVLKHVRGV